jgi:molybdate transport system ATP-binding protein
MSGPGAINVAFKGMLGQFRLEAAFTAPPTGITGLFGPSGCGKTGVLRCIAGLHRLPDGACAIDGEIWQDKSIFQPTFKRSIGYVFQEASLFPHLSVRRNLLYGANDLGSRGGPKAIALDEIIALLGLARLLERSPRNLSGGERQRVAIGRALMSRPKLLLMDEPLSALDAQTKDEILPFLERLHGNLQIPVIYVSHDLAEVERLADHLVLMQDGKVIASGKLNELQSDPTLPLATSRGAAVSLDAIVETYDSHYGLATLAVEGGRFLTPSPTVAPGEKRRLKVFASDISLAREPPVRSTIVNTMPVRILGETPLSGHEITAVLGLGPNGDGARLLARVTRRSWDMLELAVGMELYAQVKGVALIPP